MTVIFEGIYNDEGRIHRDIYLSTKINIRSTL